MKLGSSLVIALVGMTLTQAQASSTSQQVLPQSPEHNGSLNASSSQDAASSNARTSRDLCDNAIVLDCNTTYSGSSANSQNGNLWEAYCFSGETAGEIIHVLDHPGGLLNLTLSSTDSAQLDLILLGSCDPGDCLAMPWLVGSFETVSGVYAPGTYYVVVDAYQWDGQPFTYDLEVECVGEQDFCANAIPLTCGETMFGSSSDSQNGDTWTAYCFSGETGPEVIYSLEHPGGILNLELSSADNDQLDLILLGSCDPGDCLAMPWFVGSSETINGEFAAGTYYVVVDAYSWNGNPFTFELDVFCPGELDPCATALPLASGEVVEGGSNLAANGNLWSSYCFSGETAPEVIYAYEHTGGELTLSLSSVDSNQLDLILLGGCNPGDCLAMPWLVGSEETIIGDWPAGVYYVVVDAFLWDGNPFTYTLSAQSGSGTVDASEAPASFQLGKAYPNPFNPSTTLQFSLAETSAARLAVYDLSGRLVEVLVDGLQERGDHAVTFRADGLPGGLYICTLEVGARKASQKVLLLK